MKHLSLFPKLVKTTGLALAMSASVATADVIFYESFDSTPDWTSAASAPPANWYGFRETKTWAPSTGHPDRHEGIEILSSNSSLARGYSGKSAVFWRESYTGGGGHANDKIIAYRTPEGLDQMYVEFYIRFSPDWTTSGPAANFGKLFRMLAWDEDGSNPPRLFSFFEDGNAGPMLLWQYSSSDQWGMRNFQSLRGGPYGENYWMSTPSGFPRPLNNGDSSLNFTDNTIGQGPGGSTPALVDHVNGGFISDNLGQTVRHEQIFGRPSDNLWTKVAYYVEMNSSPGTPDGVLSQWINGERVLHNTNIPWIGPTNLREDVQWNVVQLGGNEQFRIYPDGQRYEEWYAIDDLTIMDSIPDDVADVDAPQVGGECVVRPSN